MNKNTASSTSYIVRYSNLEIAIHWFTVILLVIIFALPIARHFFANIIGGMGTVFMLHKSLAVILFILTIARIYIIVKQGAPDTLPKHARLQKILSKIVQGLLYLLLLLLPLSGFIMSGRAIDMFSLFQIPVLDIPSEIRSKAHAFHLWAPYLMAILIFLHTLAALFHHYIQKDTVLLAMLPESKKS